MGAKYWEIRESYGEKKSSETKEAYECGYEDGYEAAMEEMGERDDEDGMGERGGMRYGMKNGYSATGRPRHNAMGERRGRDSMGRYR